MQLEMYNSYFSAWFNSIFYIPLNVKIQRPRDSKTTWRAQQSRKKEYKNI